MADFLKLIQDQKDEGLEARWKADEDLLYLKKYIMTDTSNDPVADIVNVTLNRPAVFAANVISALGSTSEQRVVESEVKDLDTHYIEDFQKAGFASANDRLRKRGLPLLNPFADTQFSIRGGAARRILFRMEDGVLIPDITSWDRRFVRYALGENGLDWAAYEMTRPKAAIEADYGIVVKGKSGKIVDAWNTEGNFVYIDGKLVLEQEHDWDFTPVVVEIVLLGYGAILFNEESLKREGESIFFMMRDTIPELNRLISIMQTLNLKAVKPPMKVKIKGQGEAPEYGDITDMGTTTRIEPDEDIQPISYGDAQRSATIAFNMMNADLDEATISPSDLGQIERPPASGIRAILAGEHINNLLAPRLDAKAGINKQTAEMFTEQVIQIGGSVELGVKGHKRTFEVSQLDGEYDTTYKYTFTSPSTDAGLYSLAAAAGHLIPDGGPHGKRTDILHREDPDGDEKQLAWEEAPRISPAVKLYRTITSLLGKSPKPEVEAAFLAAELDMSLNNLLAGDIEQLPKPEPRDEPTQVLSLFGGNNVSPEVAEEE